MSRSYFTTFEISYVFLFSLHFGVRKEVVVVEDSFMGLARCYNVSRWLSIPLRTTLSSLNLTLSLPPSLSGSPLPRVHGWGGVTRGSPGNLGLLQGTVTVTLWHTQAWWQQCFPLGKWLMTPTSGTSRIWWQGWGCLWENWRGCPVRLLQSAQDGRKSQPYR